MLKKSFSSISLLLFFFLISCVNEAEQSTNDLGVLSPIKLGASDTTIVLLEDYFLDKKEVTGVNLPNGWTSAFSEQKDSLLEGLEALHYLSRVIRRPPFHGV